MVTSTKKKKKSKGNSRSESWYGGGRISETRSSRKKKLGRKKESGYFGTEFKSKRAKTSVEGRLLETFGKVSDFGSKNDDRRELAWDLYEGRLLEMHRLGEVEFTGEDSVDLDAIGKAIVSRRSNASERLRDAMRKVNNSPHRGRKSFYGRGNAALLEHVVHAFDGSGMRRFMDACVRLGSWELCDSVAGYDEINSCVPTRQVGCDQEKLASDPALPDIDLCERAPDEEVEWFGLHSPLEMRLPRRKTVQLAFGYKEDVCIQFRAALERYMNQGATILAKAKAKMIMRLIFDLYKPGQNPWPFELNCHGFDTYYPVVPAEEEYGAWWMNLVYNKMDLTGCNMGPFRFVEDRFCEILDPRTGEPMSCCDDKKIIAPGKRTSERFTALLNGYSVEHCGGEGDCPGEKVTRNVGPRSGWDRSVKFNDWMWHCFRKLLCNLHPEKTSEQIRQKIERTFYAGCPDRQFAVLSERGAREQTHHGPNTWIAWNQGVIFATKYDEKCGGATINPWAGQLFTGMCDDEVPPNLPMFM